MKNDVWAGFLKHGNLAFLRKSETALTQEKIRLEKDAHINLLMDNQACLQGGGPGMEHWMKIYNLKEAAKTLNYLTEHGITDDDLLVEKAEKVAADFETISTSIFHLAREKEGGL